MLLCWRSGHHSCLSFLRTGVDSRNPHVGWDLSILIWPRRFFSGYSGLISFFSKIHSQLIISGCGVVHRGYAWIEFWGRHSSSSFHYFQPFFYYFHLIFVRLVARQNSRKYTVRMTMKKPYSRNVFIVELTSIEVFSWLKWLINQTDRERFVPIAGIPR